MRKQNRNNKYVEINRRKKYRRDIAYITKIPQFFLYTDEMYKKDCFYYKTIKKTLCTKQMFIEKCDYDLLVSHKNETKCFEKLPKNESFITQIENNLYFTISSPLTIKIACEKERERAIRLARSTNILDAQNCTIEASTIL